MKKIVVLALPFSLLFLTSSIQAVEGLGCRPPTADEQAWMNDNLIIPDVVIPNSTAIARVNEERQRAGLPLMNLIPAPEQDDVVGRTAQMRRARTPELIVRSAPPAIPAAVDNSLLNAFPPVGDQGGIGSCACFSTTYYTMTYMSARARGVDVIAGGNATIFSPKFCYNFINGGQDLGSWITTAYSVQQNHGVPTLAAWPYDGNFREWPITADIWRNAIPSRMSSSGAVYALDTDPGLKTMKQMIANGYVLNFATNIWGWQFTTIANDPGTTADDAFVGNAVCHWHSNAGGGHAMTVVGYNDNLWVDLNGNGSVDAGEKGALRIVNNWGGGWGNGGKAWLMYDALKAVTGVAGGITDATRDAAWWGNAAYWITARPAHQPTVLGEFTLNTASRSVLGISLGASSTTQTSPTALQSSSMNNAGGLFAFDGTTTSGDGTFVFDLTDKVLAGTARYYLEATNYYPSGHPCVVRNFRLTDAGGNTLSGPIVTNPSGGLPLNVDSNPVLAWADLAQADVIAPSAISDLATNLVTPTSITATWTSTGDDAVSGTATTYDLRYSTSPITTSNWESTIQASGEPSPKPPGSTEIFQISGLTPGTTYYIAIVSIDEANNVSALSNIITEITPDVLTINSPTILPEASVGVSYSTTLTASGGTGSHTWSSMTGHIESNPGMIAIPAVGSARAWNNDTGSWNYSFPSGFTFPFAGSARSTVRVSSDGYLEFGNTVTSKSGNDLIFKSAPMIAVCWRDLTTAGTQQAGEDIYILEETDAVTIRWVAETMSSGSVGGQLPPTPIPVDAQVTLFRDGTIACAWRVAANYNGYSGVSDGDGIHWKASDISYRNFVSGTRRTWDYLSWPAGLSLDGSTGLISGNPTTSGVYKLGINVTDSGYPIQNVFETRILQIGIPHITSTLSTSGTVGSPFSYQILGTPTPTTFSASGLPPGLICDGVGLISGIPTASGTTNVTLSVGNAVGSSSVTLAILINPVANVAPVVAVTIPNQTGIVGTTFKYIITAGTFTDGDSDVLTWSASNLPAGLSFEAATHTISGVPTTVSAPMVTVSVNDGNGHTVSTTFTITISPPANVAPVVAATIPNQTGIVNTAFSYTIPVGAFTDADGDALVWSASNLPAGLSFTSGARIISGTPTTASAPTVTVSVNDGNGHTVSTTFTITISAPANVAPVVAATIPNQIGVVGSTFGYTIAAGTFTDADSDVLTWSISNLPAGLSFDAATRTITGVPTTVSAPVVTVLVNDGNSHTVSTTFTITINAPVNIPPSVKAGSNMVIRQVDAATLSAIVKDDGLPTPATLRIEWSQVKGPGTVTWSQPQAASTTVRFSDAGLYTLQIRVSDGDLATMDTINVLVINSEDPDLLNRNDTSTKCGLGGGLAVCLLSLSLLFFRREGRWTCVR